MYSLMPSFFLKILRKRLFHFVKYNDKKNKTKKLKVNQICIEDKATSTESTPAKGGLGGQSIPRNARIEFLP